MTFHLLMTEDGNDYLEHDDALAATMNMGHGSLACAPKVFPSKSAAKAYAKKRAKDNPDYNQLFPVPLRPSNH